MKIKCLAAAIAMTLTPMMVVTQATANVNVFLDESTLINDLQGELSGSVKFAQTHTINAENNASKELPRLISTRDTLVMLIPSVGAIQSLTLIARNKEGELLGTLTMRTPEALPRADRPHNSLNPEAVYSDKAWSQVIPADWMQPGLQLEFKTADNKSGSLNSLDIGGETQVVLQNIRIGMLTPPGSLDKNPLEKESQKLAEDYFQKIPVSQLIVGNYSPVELSEVVLSTGKRYTSHSDDTGGVYNGDMRENIGKGIISMGIDNANFGVNSSQGGYSWQPGLFHQVAVHQSKGRYINGVIQHGLSGGNGMATLYDTIGNEFSHEIGHGFGMGHYPGGGKWSIHNRESGWGWDSIHNRFIANFFWDRTGDTPAEGGGDTHVTPPFLGIYKYNRDTMGGGEASSPLSKYTLHTGYTQKRIQQWLESKAVITAHSDSGYLIWNEQQKKMVQPQGELYRKPDAFGVPVVTLVGYYDPQGKLGSYIYPALHGSYGYAYPPETIKKGQCWAEVVYPDGHSDKFGIEGFRLRPGDMNMFHINVPESKKPESVQVACPEQDTEAAYYNWKLEKLGVNTFYDWSRDKDEALGSIYYYPDDNVYFRLKSKPFWYFPATAVDNHYWTYLTNETSLKNEYQNLPINSTNEYVLAERSIDAATVAPQPAAVVGHFYEDKESEAPAPNVALDRSTIDAVATTDFNWGYRVQGISNQENVTWKWEHVEGNQSIYINAYDTASAEIVVPKELFDTSAKFRLTATNSDNKSGEAFVTIGVVAPAVRIIGPTSMDSAEPVTLRAEANFDEPVLSWSLKRGAEEIVKGIDANGLIKSGLPAGEYRVAVTASNNLGGRFATQDHAVSITEEAQNTDRAFVSALVLAMQPSDKGNAVTFSGSVQSSTPPTSTPVYLWTLPAGAQGGSNGQLQQSFTINKTSQVQNLTLKVQVTAGQASRELEQNIVVPAASGGDTYPEFARNTPYNAGNIVRSRNGKLYQCIQYPTWCTADTDAKVTHYEPGIGIHWSQAWKLYQ